MKFRLGLIIGTLAVMLVQFASIAFAQTPVQPGYQVCNTNDPGNTHCSFQPVDATHGLPVAATITPSGTQNINIAQILGAAPSLTNPLWVFPATGATFPVSGTVTANQGTAGSAWPVTLTSTTITGTVGVTQSTSPWVVSNSGTFVVQDANVSLQQAPVAPATATATKSALGGCQATSAAINPTTGQQAAVDCDLNNNLLVSAGGAPNLATSQASVTTGNISVAGARALRRAITITNVTGTGAAFCGNTGVTTSTGTYLGATAGSSMTLNTTAAVFCTVATTTQTVAVAETF